MDKIVLDDALREKLTANGSDVELFDRSGQLCGYFLTPDAYLRILYELAKAEDIDEEEIEAMVRDCEQNGGLTTVQVLDYLKTLNPSNGGRK